MPENAETAALSQVGVLGAGRMGRPIIGHLARAGYPTLVYDPNEDTRPAVEDRGAGSPPTPGRSPPGAR